MGVLTVLCQIGYPEVELGWGRFVGVENGPSDKRKAEHVSMSEGAAE